MDYVGVTCTAGMMLLVLLILLVFTAAIAHGMALRRRALKKRKHPEGNGETVRRAVLYQGLDVGTLNYVSEYTELKGGTYQELDLKGREEEHHYQSDLKSDVLLLL